jgi:hypothetical protein
MNNDNMTSPKGDEVLARLPVRAAWLPMRAAWLLKLRQQRDAQQSRFSWSDVNFLLQQLDTRNAEIAQLITLLMASRVENLNK